MCAQCVADVEKRKDTRKKKKKKTKEKKGNVTRTLQRFVSKEQLRRKRCPLPPFSEQQLMTAVPITFICAMQLQLFLFFFYPSYSPTTFSQYFINSLLFCFLRFRIVYSCHPYTQTLTHIHTHIHTHVLLHTGFHLSFSDSNSTNDTLFSINWSPLSLFFCICSIKPQLFLLTFFFFLLACFSKSFFCFSIKRPFSQSLFFFFFFVSLLLTSTSFSSCSDIYIYIYSAAVLSCSTQCHRCFPVFTLCLSSLGPFFFVIQLKPFL